MEKNNNILSHEEEMKLLAPIDEHIGDIQRQINALREDGTDKVVSLTNHMAIIRENANYTKLEKAQMIAADKKSLEQARLVESKNKDQVNKLISEAVTYLDQNYDKEYYSKVLESCKIQKQEEEERYRAEVSELTKQHQADLAKLSDAGEIRDEKYVFKNKLFDAKLKHDSTLQNIKDRQYDAFSHRYHLIDLLRLSKFTYGESWKQGWENYKYSFNVKQFLLNNGLYHQTYAAAYSEQCAEHPDAGIAQNVPGTWRRRTDPPRRYGPVCRPNGRYQYGHVHHDHAQGNQYGRALRKDLRFFGPSGGCENRAGAGCLLLHYDGIFLIGGILHSPV